MEKKRLVLTGSAGYSEGEIFSIPVGESAIVGRSRSCDFSLRKLKSWMDANKDEREDAEEFKTVSRRHIKIEVSTDGDGVKVSITDLSRNGTFVDEDRIDARFDITDWDMPHYLRLGELEQYKLEIKDAGDDLEDVKQIPDEDEDGDSPDEETDRHKKPDDDNDDDDKDKDKDKDE